MSENYRIKTMVNVLENGKENWWPIADLIEEVISGFKKLPVNMQAELTSLYGTYIPHVRSLLSDNNQFLLRRGWGWKASYKCATKDDLPFIKAQLESEANRSINNQKRITGRLEMLRTEGLLPDAWTPRQLN